jgi:hypothetical protein
MAGDAILQCACVALLFFALPAPLALPCIALVLQTAFGAMPMQRANHGKTAIVLFIQLASNSRA